MGIADILGEIRSRLNQTSPKYAEVAAMMMPKGLTGIKHMLRPACRFLPMPMTLGWQEGPKDDDYPPRLLVPGLQLTDIESGATWAVVAPWMHALYAMTYERQPDGVTEIELEEAQFTESLTTQHFAVLCVLCTQGIFGIWAWKHHEFRECAFIFLGIFLQVMEACLVWIFPIYTAPRLARKPRIYVLHKGVATTHLLVVSHQPDHERSPKSGPLYISLEDAAVPMPILRKGYKRILETSFRMSLQLAKIGLRASCVFSQANGFLIPFILSISTIASEIITKVHTPLPRYSFMGPLETAERRPSVLDMMAAICIRTGCLSVGFVEAILPDREGEHVDFQWLKALLQSGSAVAGPHRPYPTANEMFTAALRRRIKKFETESGGHVTPLLNPSLNRGEGTSSSQTYEFELCSLAVVEEIIPQASVLLISNFFRLEDISSISQAVGDDGISEDTPLSFYGDRLRLSLSDASHESERGDAEKYVWVCCLKILCRAFPQVSSLAFTPSRVSVSFLPPGRTTIQDLRKQLFDAALKILFSVMFDEKFGPDFDVMVPDLAHFREFLRHTRYLSSWLVWIQRHVPAELREAYAVEMDLRELSLDDLSFSDFTLCCLEIIADQDGNIIAIYCSEDSHEDSEVQGSCWNGSRDQIMDEVSELKRNAPSTRVTVWGKGTHKCAVITQSLPNGYSWIYYFSSVSE